MRGRWVAGLAVAGLVLALAGAACGGFLPDRGSRTGETATIWVTKNRGATLVERGSVPAGESLMRGLRSLTSVETRYGGRFVESIDGVSGDASAHRDWFWFVNGLLGNESAADYVLQAGDVAWWDYRDWDSDYSTEVVVGAFPEPFLHGYGGHVRPAAVRYAPHLKAAAARIGKLLHARSVAPLGAPVAEGANELDLVTGRRRFTAALRTAGTGPRGAVVFTYAGPVGDLLQHGPKPYLRRFSLP